MPTSTSRTCNPTQQPALEGRHQSGFTLLEILVVVALAGILTGVVVLGFTGADRSQKLEGEIERLAMRMDLARQRAVQRNREIGFNADQDRYRFSELDRETGNWLPLTERPFGEIELDKQYRLYLKVEERDAKDRKQRQEQKRGKDGDSERPDLVFFRSGELTPFTARIESEDQRLGWSVTSDGLGGIEMARIQ